MESSSVSTNASERGLDGKGSGPRCQFKKCPGYDQKTVIRVAFKTVYRCEECSMNRNTDVFGFVIQPRRSTESKQ
jgi:hypothetical protein